MNRHGLSRAGEQVLARCRGERARRRREVRRAAGTGGRSPRRCKATAASTDGQRLRALPAQLLNGGILGGNASSAKRREDDARAADRLGRRAAAAVVESVALAEFPAGRGKDKWGLGFQLAAEKATNRRSPGSGTWDGIFNTHFFVDPARQIGVVVMMQTLPFYDEKSMAVYAGVEDAVYGNLQ
jgi:CubicO group peptidase (beta-lactamase class C family)